MFPDRDIMFGDFTIITISQKTKEDMTGWSEDVEVEREELLKTVCAKMGLVARKRVFRDFRHSVFQTSLLSYRD